MLGMKNSKEIFQIQKRSFQMPEQFSDLDGKNSSEEEEKADFACSLSTKVFFPFDPKVP